MRDLDKSNKHYNKILFNQIKRSIILKINTKLLKILNKDKCYNSNYNNCLIKEISYKIIYEA